MVASTFTRYEEARIVGARALQIAMGAPILIGIPKDQFAVMRFSPIEVAKREYFDGVLPMTIKRPLPARTA